MKHANRYSPELREWAVRLVLDPPGGHETQWGAIVSVSSKVDYSAETLCKWMRRAERDTGVRPGLTSDERARLKALASSNRSGAWAIRTTTPSRSPSSGRTKTKGIRPRGPWRGLEAVEFATLERVDWFNHRRILEPIGDRPPAEAEAAYYR